MSRKSQPAQPGDRTRIEVIFDRPQLLGRVFGEYDTYLVAIENRLGVYISARGNRVQIEGEAEAAARARDVLQGLYNRILKGENIDNGAVEAVIAMSAEPTLDGIIRHERVGAAVGHDPHAQEDDRAAQRDAGALHGSADAP